MGWTDMGSGAYKNRRVQQGNCKPNPNLTSNWESEPSQVNLVNPMIWEEQPTAKSDSARYILGNVEQNAQQPYSDTGNIAREENERPRRNMWN